MRNALVRGIFSFQVDPDAKYLQLVCTLKSLNYRISWHNTSKKTNTVQLNKSGVHFLAHRLRTMVRGASMAHVIFGGEWLCWPFLGVCTCGLKRLWQSSREIVPLRRWRTLLRLQCKCVCVRHLFHPSAHFALHSRPTWTLRKLDRGFWKSVWIMRICNWDYGIRETCVSLWTGNEDEVGRTWVGPNMIPNDCGPVSSGARQRRTLCPRSETRDKFGMMRMAEFALKRSASGAAHRGVPSDWPRDLRCHGLHRRHLHWGLPLHTPSTDP